MQRNVNTVNIKPDKLREEIKKRDLNCTIISKELGYSERLIHNALHTGRIRFGIVKMLEMMYNIKPETYVFDPTDVPGYGTDEKKPEATVPKFDWQRFYNVIYEATYNAFKKAMNE